MMKQRIIEHARDRFLGAGFSKVTMDELSQEIGISKKTMYQHFRSKDTLIDAVMERQVAEIGKQVKEILGSSEDVISKLYRLWITMGQMACRISKQFQNDLRRYRPDLWKRVETIRKKILLENFAKVIDEGVSQRLVRTDVNKEVIVLMYLSSVQGIVNPDVLSHHSFSTEEALKTILRVYLDGILTEKARKQFHKRISSSLV